MYQIKVEPGKLQIAGDHEGISVVTAVDHPLIQIIRQATAERTWYTGIWGAIEGVYGELVESPFEAVSASDGALLCEGCPIIRPWAKVITPTLPASIWLYEYGQLVIHERTGWQESRPRLTRIS